MRDIGAAVDDPLRGAAFKGSICSAVLGHRDYRDVCGVRAGQLDRLVLSRAAVA